MNVQQGLIHTSHGSGGDCRQPVSLETIAMLEQVLAEMLRSLRDSATSRSEIDAGAIEYESWLRGARN